ncbi:MAG: Na+/H+ antiporter NhaC [Candidatus Cloacimonadota bacterium]|nr:MAG: Na+/H+ antiporter NhaC [Candidatus Cloacimonadota bacterium]
MADEKEPSLVVALIPVVFLITMLVMNQQMFKDDATYGPNQLALLLSGMLTLSIGFLHLKVSYKKIEKNIIDSIGLSLQACLILLVVGSLISIWILSGIVPTMIFYGLKIINPSYFLPVACISCAMVALATGSSWSTTGTIGVALMGIGQALSIPIPMCAGAIISGAYFGDKMSPLSDTTNLAPAMAGTDLFTHIRHMVYTSGPAIIISIIGYFILGFYYSGTGTDASSVDAILTIIKSNFNIGLHLFLVPLILLILISKKMAAFPALIIGTILGVIAAVFFQWELLTKLTSNTIDIAQAYKEVIKIAFSGFNFDFQDPIVNKLFNRGGMASMLNTVWLIMMAMVFGGAMEGTGMLQKIASTILQFVVGAGSLIGATLATCLFLNMTASDQYLAIVVPGKMFKSAYDDMGLHPKNLSRALEDSGTVTSVLIPWNSGGAYNTKVLGVGSEYLYSYQMYCFFNILSPLVSLFLASMNLTIERVCDEKSSQA